MALTNKPEKSDPRRELPAHPPGPRCRKGICPFAGRREMQRRIMHDVRTNKRRARRCGGEHPWVQCMCPAQFSSESIARLTVEDNDYERNAGHVMVSRYGISSESPACGWDACFWLSYSRIYSYHDNVVLPVRSERRMLVDCVVSARAQRSSRSGASAVQ